MDDVIRTLAIILSVLLISAIILQVKGTGSGLFGSTYATFRTRRGFERVLFRGTVILAIVFIGVSIWSARVL